jgi:hypothetical protein
MGHEQRSYCRSRRRRHAHGMGITFGIYFTPVHVILLWTCIYFLFLLYSWHTCAHDYKWARRFMTQVTSTFVSRRGGLLAYDWRIWEGVS